MSKRHHRYLLTAALAAVALLTGCASTSLTKDPLEGFNRAMFAFNEGVDQLALRPAAKGYELVVPAPVRSGVTNFFSNVGDLSVAFNDALQGKGSDAATDVGRFVVNTTVGVLGVMDVATEWGMEKHDEDFGQTLGKWGIGDGPYLVLPLLGPRTTRDAAARLTVDMTADAISHIHKVAPRNAAYGLRLVDDRATLLPADKVIEEAALDKYSYIRDAYLQRRRNLVHDGNPPRRTDDD